MNLLKSLCTTLFVLIMPDIQNHGHCQVVLSRQVIGAYGSSSQLEFSHVEYTLGEAVIPTLNSASYTLTQGFHQPSRANADGLLNWNLEVVPVSCSGATDGEALITDITGCLPPFEIIWSNGINGSINRPLSAGLYSVTVIGQNCERTVAFEVGVSDSNFCRLRFYNAFSPNSDGVNDSWEIENIGLPEFSDNHVEIYNRWGQMVWSGTRYDNAAVAWHGLDQEGEELPHATYFYLVTAGGVLYKGYVELTR